MSEEETCKIACNLCGASGVKLWRDERLKNPILYCRKCLALYALIEPNKLNSSYVVGNVATGGNYPVFFAAVMYWDGTRFTGFMEMSIEQEKQWNNLP